MQKILFSMLSVAMLAGIINTAAAQEDNSTVNKQEEIILRKKGDKDVKITIETKNDELLINGKPLSEFKDDNISVRKTKKITRNGNDIFIRPGGGNSFFYNENEDEETRPFLGVTSEKTINGIKITDVAKGSAAEKAGLKEDDIITRIGSKKITDPEELMDAVTAYKPKDEVKVAYLRNGKSNEATAILGERKESRAKRFSFNRDEIPGMNEDMTGDFNFEMPPMPTLPKQPFYSFRTNKKLGLKIEDTDNDGGVKITNVAEGSTAEKAGLRKEDIITEIDGQKVKNTSEAREKVLSNEKNGYTIKAKRGSLELKFEIKIPKKINSADL